MTDATATASPDETDLAVAAARSGTSKDVQCVVSSVAQGIEEYAHLCRTAIFAPAQSAPWIRHWTDKTKPDAFIATLRLHGSPVLALALEVQQWGPFRIARFMGGRHANGNFAAASPAWLDGVSCAHIRALFDAVAKARPDIDVLALQRLTPTLSGKENPLASLPSFPSPNVSLAVDLSGGFESVLSRSSGKRKRKKHRSQTRKFEAAGGFRRIEAASPEVARTLLDAFFAMKEQRFRRMGIPNVFGDPKVRVFFHALFEQALEESPPPFVLHGLEVAGRLRAVTGSSRAGERLVCEFGAIAEDELAYASPGDFLFFENIREACDRGHAVYDFSVGDEPYKRLWCDIETQHLDVLVPLTWKGRALALALHQNARGKAFVKNSPTIWRLTKMLRRKAAGQPATLPDDDKD